MKSVLKEYVVKKYGAAKLEEIVNKNYLNYVYTEKPHDVKFLLNKANVIALQNELIRICKIFDRENIEYITFKGVVLSNILYDNIYTRFFRDVDIYVFPQCFEKSLDVLCNNGYIIKNKKVLSNPHHVALRNGKIRVELHRRIFNPTIKIIETFLIKNLQVLTIDNQKINTFNLTSTMLHLVYHLYMDTYLLYWGLYQSLVSKEIPKAHRFLYRAYEIALFSERYSNKISWDEIEKDLKCQEFRIVFKIMIFCILEIFPNAFPDSFVKTVCNIKYIEDDRDRLYKYWDQTDITKSENFNSLRSKYIDDNWKSIQNNINIEIGEKISLVKKISNAINNGLTCDITTEKTIDGLKIIFKVSNYDFCISDFSDYNTQTSDGIHLVICGTEMYSYNSMFFFPKEVNGKIKVIVSDFLDDSNKVLGDDLIKTDFCKTENNYTITAILSDKFLKENHLSSYLYMGLIISDCNSRTHQRENQLILSKKSSEWYNPVYFARINIR